MNFRIKFSKYGVLKFVGHLDLMRYLQKAIRRSGIDAIYTKGFNPHQIMSFALPLGVGLTSDGEYVDIELHQIDESELRNNDTDVSQLMIKKLNAVMTEGFLVTDFVKLKDWELNQRKETAMSQVVGADYKVSLNSPDIIEKARFHQLFYEFMNQDEILVTKKTKKKDMELNLKPYIYGFAPSIEGFAKQTKQSIEKVKQGLEHAEWYDGDVSIYLQLAAGSALNLKPELIMEAFFQKINSIIPQWSIKVHRLELYQDVFSKGISQLEVQKALFDGTLVQRKLVPMSERL